MEVRDLHFRVESPPPLVDGEEWSRNEASALPIDDRVDAAVDGLRERPDTKQLDLASARHDEEPALALHVDEALWAVQLRVAVAHLELDY